MTNPPSMYKYTLDTHTYSAPGVSEAELRKKAREERKKELERLKAAKPDKNIDDPKDVAAMRYAQENMYVGIVP